ncbi:hypothetical protein RCKICKAPOO_2 [Rhodobacter phage RcKickapoo]|nr:hypothetical protein RCKICKAPOO_2 [Rhodobacter phage RcKickapoo]
MQFPITVTVRCADCGESYSSKTRSNTPAAAAKELEKVLDEHKWQPLTIGKQTVGVLCAECAAERLGVPSSE